MNIMRPPKHFGDLIKDANSLPPTPDGIRDGRATITDIVWFLLKSMYILVKEVHLLKQRIQ